MSKKIANCSFGILLSFINEIAKNDDDITWTILVNMKKYFMEYPKNQMFVCFDGRDSYVIFKIEHNHDEYLFVEFVPRNIRIVSAF